jgi:hypothetical protein
MRKDIQEKKDQILNEKTLTEISQIESNIEKVQSTA